MSPTTRLAGIPAPPIVPLPTAAYLLIALGLASLRLVDSSERNQL